MRQAGEISALGCTHTHTRSNTQARILRVWLLALFTAVGWFLAKASSGPVSVPSPSRCGRIQGCRFRARSCAGWSHLLVFMGQCVDGPSSQWHRGKRAHTCECSAKGGSGVYCFQQMGVTGCACTSVCAGPASVCSSSVCQQVNSPFISQVLGRQPRSHPSVYMFTLLSSICVYQNFIRFSPPLYLELPLVPLFYVLSVYVFSQYWIHCNSMWRSAAALLSTRLFLVQWQQTDTG